jgi:hypothetical protein
MRIRLSHTFLLAALPALVFVQPPAQPAADLPKITEKQPFDKMQ